MQRPPWQTVPASHPVASLQVPPSSGRTHRRGVPGVTAGAQRKPSGHSGLARQIAPGVPGTGSPPVGMGAPTSPLALVSLGMGELPGGVVPAGGTGGVVGAGVGAGAGVRPQTPDTQERPPPQLVAGAVHVSPLSQGTAYDEWTGLAPHAAAQPVAQAGSGFAGSKLRSSSRYVAGGASQLHRQPRNSP